MKDVGCLVVLWFKRFIACFVNKQRSSTYQSLRRAGRNGYVQGCLRCRRWGSLIGVQQILFFGTFWFCSVLCPLIEEWNHWVSLSRLKWQIRSLKLDVAVVWPCLSLRGFSGPRCIRCASWAPSLKVDNLFGIQCAYHQDCGGSHLTGNHRFIDTFLIGQLLEECSGIPPCTAVNTCLTASAYFDILNSLISSSFCNTDSPSSLPELCT